MLWVSIQAILFILPLTLGTIDIIIKYNKIPYYLQELERNREIVFNSKLTDFAESELVAIEYSEKVGEYKCILEHPIMFYFRSMIGCFILSLILQLPNSIWFNIYKNDYLW